VIREVTGLMDNGHTRLRGRDRGRPVGQGAEAVQGEGNATERSAKACGAGARLGGDFGALPEIPQPGVPCS